jgi:hypothetical protein
VLVIGVSVAVAAFVVRKDDGGPSGPAAVTINCLGGSEKTELMADPEIQKILRDRYGVTVTFKPLGSYDQVQLATDQLKSRSIDCLWPASASAQSVFEAQHQGAFPEYRAETVLQSPEVIYAGPEGTQALMKEKIVTIRDNRYFIVDFKRLLLDYVLTHKDWQSLGSPTLRGPITVASTDPARSNSGFTLTQLQLNVIATQDVFSAPNAAKAKAALPTVRALYDAQGLQATSSDFGFNQWLLQGAELHAPLYAGYENQIVQYMLGPNANAGALKDTVRVLYPEPTIYSDHPILALNANAAKLIDAMKDAEVQTLAWKKFGFRSGTQVGLNKVTDFPDIPLAQQIRTTTPPNAEVTLLLLACVKDASKCS